MVYVPVKEGLETLESGRTIKLRIPHSRGETEGRNIPVFTSPEHLMRWSAQNDACRGSVQIICAELCLALEGKGGVHINPASEFSLQLDPKDKEAIARLI